MCGTRAPIFQRARALAPNWAAAAHLEINIDGIGQKKAKEAWARIRRLKETLALDPRNASVMTSIGDILFKELERPREAEGFYREALLIDPTNKICQGKLLDSIRARSLLYRTLSLPAMVVRSIRERKMRWFVWIYVILAIKLVVFLAAWVVGMGLFFTPAAVIYEWFVLADIPRTKPLPRILAPLHTALLWPLWLRLAMALTAIVGLWLLILWKPFGIRPALALPIMAATFGIHFIAVSLLVGFRRLGARVGHWQEARRMRREKGAIQSEM